LPGATLFIPAADKWLPNVGDFFAVWRPMSDLASTDRRRVPRAAIADTELSVLAFPIPVRLLDISLGGVLLESSHVVDLGTRGTLRFNFGGVPFSADVKVERLERQRNDAGERFTIGASFVALSRQDQRVIERFADQ
jgi:hypothetical protein